MKGMVLCCGVLEWLCCAEHAVGHAAMATITTNETRTTATERPAAPPVLFEKLPLHHSPCASGPELQLANHSAACQSKQCADDVRG